MQNGRYETENGSVMVISGEHGGESRIVFDWVEEDACCDCEVEAYDVDGYLVWHCEVCGGGKAELKKTPEPVS